MCRPTSNRRAEPPADVRVALVEQLLDGGQVPHPRASADSEAGKQSRKTFLHIFERYTEGYMTLIDAIQGVKQWFKHSI